jgi:SAM-dependent methyltransferase
MIDIRDLAARFYDSNPDFPDDIPFYQAVIPPGDIDILELGCGTGRVTIPLAAQCRTIHGIDLSPAMLALCRQKLSDAGIPSTRAQVALGDITDFFLERQFDWIIAPFRVLQNLESDEQVHGLFRCMRAHLAPGGCCILNVFHPNRDPEGLRQHWVKPHEVLDWDEPVEDGRITCHARFARMDPEKLVLYPELIYRRYKGEQMVEEAVLKIAMRCYYPDEFEALVVNHGFEIVACWGGYHGEAYGHGPELVLQFCAS